MDFEWKESTYPLRMIVLFDHGLCARKRKTLQNRINKTCEAFKELNTKVNRYRLKTKENIDKDCKSILKGRQTTSFFTYRIVNEPTVLYKNKTALQMVVLIERTARENISDREPGLDGFMPNMSDLRNPKN